MIIMKKIAVLGANYPLLSFYKQAKQLGYEIYSFASGDDTICSKYADYFYPISFTETDEIIKICKKNNIDGVISFSLESALPYVYKISRELGVPCNSEGCEKLTANKFTMRERLNLLNVSIPSYQILDSNEENVNIPFPLIVKPVDSGGSQGVTLVLDKVDLTNAIDSALEFSSSKQIIVEQYIDGREFSIESISYRGEHYILAITDKITTGPPNFVELEHHQPADISNELKEKITSLVFSTLNALKVEYGAAHTEVKLDDNGSAYVIELGARMGGDFITSDLVKLSTGYDFVNGVLEISCGEFNTPKQLDNKYAGVYFLSKQTNNLLNYIKNYKDYTAIKDCDFNNEIILVQRNADRAGYFIYQQMNSRFKIED